MFPPNGRAAVTASTRASQIEQLRFVTAEMARGATAADAHRALAQRMVKRTGREQRAEGRPRILILIAERDEYSAELIEFLLRTEGFAVEVTLDADEAEAQVRARPPGPRHLSSSCWAEAKARRCCAGSRKIGAGRTLVDVRAGRGWPGSRGEAQMRSCAAVGHLQLVSAVKDLLGFSAIVGEQE